MIFRKSISRLFPVCLMPLLLFIILGYFPIIQAYNLSGLWKVESKVWDYEGVGDTVLIKQINSSIASYFGEDGQQIWICGFQDEVGSTSNTNIHFQGVIENGKIIADVNICDWDTAKNFPPRINPVPIELNISRNETSLTTDWYYAPEDEFIPITYNKIVDFVEVEDLNFTSYNNTNLGISIQHPSDWSKIEQNFDDIINVVSFISPPDSETDDFAENVNIVVEPLENTSTTLQDYVDTNMAALSEVFGENNFNTVTIDENITLATNPAAEIVYYTNQTQMMERYDQLAILEENPIQTMTILTVNGDKGYAITYTAEKSRYDEYLPIVEKMLESFHMISFPR